MAHLVVLEARQKRIFSIEHARPGRDVLCDALGVVGLEPGRTRGEVRFRIDHQLGKIGFVERLDLGGKRSVAQSKDRRAVLARDAGGFNRDVKTFFNRGGGEHDTRTIAVAAEDRLMQIALLNVGRQTGAWTAPLDVANDEREFGHRCPADCFALQRNPRTGAAGHGEISGVGETKRERNRAQLVFGLNKKSAVFRQLAPERFHDRRPGRDRITGAVTHAGGDQSVGDRLVAIHCDLRWPAGFGLVFKLVLMRQDLADGVSVTGGKRHDGGVDDALIFAGKLFFDQRRQLLDVETKNFCDQTEHKNVFTLVLGRSAQRFHRQAGDRHADVNETFVVEVGLDIVRIVKQHAAFFEKVDVVLITVLIKRDQKIGFVTGREHFARTHADLKNRRSARDGGWNRHISHDVVVAASGQSREKRAGSLNSVLRIAGKANDGVLNIFRAQISAVRTRTGGSRSGLVRRGGFLDCSYVGINRIAHESVLRSQHKVTKVSAFAMLRRDRWRDATERWIGTSAGDAENLAVFDRVELTSSKGLLDPPSGPSLLLVNCYS